MGTSLPLAAGWHLFAATMLACVRGAATLVGVLNLRLWARSGIVGAADAAANDIERRLRRTGLRAEREALRQAAREQGITDLTLRALLREIDFQEARLGDSGRLRSTAAIAGNVFSALSPTSMCAGRGESPGGSPAHLTRRHCLRHLSAPRHGAADAP